MDDKKQETEQPLVNCDEQSAVVRPTILPITTHTSVTMRYSNIDSICMSPSPIDTKPRMFQQGTLFDQKTYEQILSSVYNPKNINDKKEERDNNHDGDGDDDDDDDNTDNDSVLNEELFDEKAINDEREQEIQYLTQVIQANQPMNDDLVGIMMQEINDTLEITIDDDNQTQSELQTSSSHIISTQHPYPPVNQTGLVKDHDRPYAEYGHLSRQVIAEECNFDLQPSTSHIPRLHAKTFAITSMTNVSKELVRDEIKQKFGIENIQYICISEEISELNHRQHLHIQIIFKEIIDRRKPFLDEITRTRCNYQVTRNDVAWNEYIKKGGNYIEFNEFKSTTKRGQTEWPVMSASISASSSSLSSHLQDNDNQPVVARRTTTTVRGQADERRQQRTKIYKQAIKLAKINVDNAMDLIEKEMIEKFVERGSWYLTIFNYVHLRAQHEADRRGNIDKEYVWSKSFPNCTPKLREAMDQWIQHHFFRAKRAKCLILIGPSGTGKTSFALSLPGRINYFQERWNLDLWNNYARYSVYDDVPWDDFAKLNFPSKKNLLTQKCNKINATDKYRGTKEINVRQPAIVLLNAEDAGSLLQEPNTTEQQNMFEYWKKRAFIYIMDPDEYFYKRQRRRPNAITTADGNQVSNSASSMSSNEERIGGQHEFDEMIQRYEEKHSK
ncbi:unnamed protein product [Adineta steineri]|uniref:Replication-associated protein n=1 Tax=Adineta steineri TaxID=433720 RepID=A0A819K8I1_9BILA|nr:unnamed protein product [Adineta steineri]CAF3943967.1 unnamed protein product [Adineta steineri]